MVDVPLHAHAALHGLAVPGRFGAPAPQPGLVIRERTDLALATVAGRRGKDLQLRVAVAAAYGIDLPDRPRAVAKNGVSFAGIGVQNWFVAAEPGDRSDFVAHLRESLAGLASVADQSDARVVLVLTGERIRDVLAKGVPIDLHPSRFRAGDVAATLVAHIGVQIQQLDERPAFQLMAFRSLAGSLWTWLTESAAEFGYEVLPPT